MTINELHKILSVQIAQGNGNLCVGQIKRGGLVSKVLTINGAELSYVKDRKFKNKKFSRERVKEPTNVQMLIID